MVSSCMGQFVHHSLLAGICTIGIGFSRPAFSASDIFDGSYSGAKTVTYGTEPVCGSDGAATVTVEDDRIQYAFGAFPLKMNVGHDGTFRGRARKGNKGGGQVIHARGRISDSGLEAEFTVNGVHGHVCSYHWSLKKA